MEYKSTTDPLFQKDTNLAFVETSLGVSGDTVSIDDPLILCQSLNGLRRVHNHLHCYPVTFTDCRLQKKQ